MKRKDVLAILGGTSSAVDGKATGSRPVIFAKTDEVARCVSQLKTLGPAIKRQTRPLTLDPLQMPPVF